MLVSWGFTLRTSEPAAYLQRWFRAESPNSESCSSTPGSPPPTTSTAPQHSPATSAHFARSLVGLDRNAAKTAFADFLDERRYNADQITFVNLLIDELTAAGVVPAGRFHEAPYVDLNPEGPEGPEGPELLFDTVDGIERRSIAE